MTKHGYAQFTEHNEWEGEEWTWFIPMAGNERELVKLALATFNLRDTFTTDRTELLTEDEVFTLCRHGNHERGYHPRYTKLDGALDANTLIGISPDDVFELLYKGKIEDLVTRRAPGRAARRRRSARR